MRSRRVLPALLLALTGACAIQPPPFPDSPISSADPLPLPLPQPVGPTPDCEIAGSSNWEAWINATPGNGRPMLIIIGRVETPGGGFRVSLHPGPTLESDPPIQQFELKVLPPPGSGTPIVDTHEVRAQIAAYPAYRSVSVRCGNRVLAVLTDIPTVH